MSDGLSYSLLVACARFALPVGLRLANLEQSNLKLAVHSENREAEGSGIAQVLLC